MARCAGDLAAGMAALNPSGMRPLVEMALEAGFVHLGRRKLGRVPDQFGGSRFRVRAPGPVAGLAGFSRPAAFLVRFQYAVRALLDRVEEVLVTGLARFRPDVGGSRGRLLRPALRY